MGLAVHEQGYSFPDLCFPLSYHQDHGKSPELVLSSQLEEVAAGAEVHIGQAISQSPVQFLSLGWA